MKTFFQVTLVSLCFVCSLCVKKDSVLGTHDDLSILTSSYDVPPSVDHGHFEFQPSPTHFSFGGYQTNFVDPAWHGQSSNGGLDATSLVANNWVNKVLVVLADVIPVAVTTILLVCLLSFLGVVSVPYFKNFKEAQETIGRAVANIDLDQLANTVDLAITKYHQLFPDDQ